MPDSRHQKIARALREPQTQTQIPHVVTHDEHRITMKSANEQRFVALFYTLHRQRCLNQEIGSCYLFIKSSK